MRSLFYILPIAGLDVLWAAKKIEIATAASIQPAINKPSKA